jgi:hypothetical protein
VLGEVKGRCEEREEENIHGFWLIFFIEESRQYNIIFDLE